MSKEQSEQVLADEMGASKNRDSLVTRTAPRWAWDVIDSAVWFMPGTPRVTIPVEMAAKLKDAYGAFEIIETPPE